MRKFLPYTPVYVLLALFCLIPFALSVPVDAQGPGPAPPPPRLDVVMLRDCDCYKAANGVLLVIVKCSGYSQLEGNVRYFYQSEAGHWHPMGTDAVQHEFTEGTYVGLTAGFKDDIIAAGGVNVAVQLYQGANFVFADSKWVPYVPLVQ
jgi:hypothetical protein